MDYNQAFKAVIDSLKESIDETTEGAVKEVIIGASESTRLFGDSGILDSLGIVILLSDLEEKLEDDFDVIVSLASDSAMSRTRSPFRSVKSLAEYVCKVVNN